MTSKAYRDVLVENANLSTRTTNCLRNGGFYRMGEVENARVPDLLRIPEFGRKSLNEIQEWFAKHGALAGERRRDSLRQLKAMEARAEELRKQADTTDRYIAELLDRLNG